MFENYPIINTFYHYSSNPRFPSSYYCVIRNPVFCICDNNGADQLRYNRAARISAFVFATSIEQSIYFQNPNFQASSHLLLPHSPVCVGPGQKNRLQVGSCDRCKLVTSVRKYLDGLLDAYNIHIIYITT